jgi:hypothetical protein
MDARRVGLAMVVGGLVVLVVGVLLMIHFGYDCRKGDYFCGKPGPEGTYGAVLLLVGAACVGIGAGIRWPKGGRRLA